VFQNCVILYKVSAIVKKEINKQISDKVFNMKYVVS
jgi:hypothetical protein